MPLRSHRKRRERGGERRAAPREAVWNHCFHGNGEQRRAHYQFRGIECRSLVIFNLHGWIGRHACRGIDEATTFSELRLMSLSFGDSANYSLLANDSARSHLSADWSWESAFLFGWGKKTVICAFQEEYLLQPRRSWMFKFNSWPYNQQEPAGNFAPTSSSSATAEQTADQLRPHRQQSNLHLANTTGWHLHSLPGPVDLSLSLTTRADLFRCKATCP